MHIIVLVLLLSQDIWALGVPVIVYHVSINELVPVTSLSIIVSVSV